jgi:hypothetical protein
VQSKECRNTIIRLCNYDTHKSTPRQPEMFPFLAKPWQFPDMWRDVKQMEELWTGWFFTAWDHLPPIPRPPERVRALE